ncbi:urease accessory protein UreE [Pollutimonas bauzanensis]
MIKKQLRGAGLAQALIRNAPKAVLPFESRRRSRQKIELDNGEPVGLALNQGAVLRHGDVLMADDGGLIVVQAAIESVLKVTAQVPQQLARAAYHLGNRHILVEVGPDYLQLEHDAVLVDMLRQLGGVTVSEVKARFEPDAGAYGGGHKHGHDASFAEDYALAQAAYAAHEGPGEHAGGQDHQEHPQDHDHGHGPDHDPGHDHDHDHSHEHQRQHEHDHGHGHDDDHSHGHDGEHVGGASAERRRKPPRG